MRNEQNSEAFDESITENELFLCKNGKDNFEKEQKKKSFIK